MQASLTVHTATNLEIIANYKSLVQPGNPSEIYKWQLFEKFKNRPDLNSDNFIEEVQAVTYSNLIYHNAIAVRKHILIANADDYKNALTYLFDESIDLEERIVTFQQRMKDVYTSLGQTLSHHHDERTISTLLSFKYPEKYPLYKYSFYKTYCEKLGIKTAPKNKKYIHYIDLVKQFIQDFIIKDAELLSIKQRFLTADCYADTNNLIFAQDILYQVLSIKESELEEEIEETTDELVSKNMIQHLNQILYGPPGTGKTYNTTKLALEICGIDYESLTRVEAKQQFDELIHEGRIVFTTFHQSMSYEDFIEGIKPVEPEKDGDQLSYRIEDGIFKKLCVEAAFSMASEGESKHTENVLDFSLAYDELVQEIEEKLNEDLEFELDSKNGGKVLVDSISPNGNIIVKHHGGARTYTVSKQRCSRLHSEIDDLNSVSNIHDQFRAIIGGSNSSAYWSVLNAIKNKLENITPQQKAERKYSYQEKKEVIDTLRPQDYKDKLGKPYILVIDEINRGNISEIFGELITLIEEDKRLGNKEALEVTLPYSKEKFGVPSNLYIIGTMNTADRSVEALDTALRRRFVFEEMPPKYDLDGLQQEFYGFKAADILETINQRIEKLLDRDHQIGHAYILNKNKKTIIESFYKNIIPLLQEYFFGDYGKMGLVLGGGFIRKIEHNSIFANFEHVDYAQFEDKETYEIINHRNDLDGFSKAIELLMNR